MRDLFAVPVLHEKLNLDADYFYNQIVDLRNARDADRTQYTSFYDEDPMKGLEWDALRAEIISNVKRYFVTVCPENPGLQNLDVRIQAWWNLYGELNHHCWHHHGGAMLAGTYYVHMDENSPGINFCSPTESLIKAAIGSFGDGTRFQQSVMLHTQSNDLLLWPSWLSHMVPEQKTFGEKLRCSISFNVKMAQ